MSPALLSVVPLALRPTKCTSCFLSQTAAFTLMKLGRSASIFWQSSGLGSIKIPRQPIPHKPHHEGRPCP